MIEYLWAIGNVYEAFIALVFDQNHKFFLFPKRLRMETMDAVSISQLGNNS